jgi:ABC-type polar amino acid transport system ATPase subunit
VNALVLRVKADGGAAVIATHDLARARPVADAVVRLEKGVLAPAEGEDEGARLAGAAPVRLEAR